MPRLMRILVFARRSGAARAAWDAGRSAWLRSAFRRKAMIRNMVDNYDQLLGARG